MDLARPMPLLGGLSASAFMRRHWQRKPLLVRSALAEPMPGFERRRLFDLAARDDVESRLVVREGERWTVRQGPLPRRSLPPLFRPGWSLLVQGLDLHEETAHRLLARFRFIADARLDDVMVSFASDAGGVGPHLDSYDVFLIQLTGRRRWRVGRTARPRLRSDVPLKMLADFVPQHEWLLERGDMLYLPPGWGHDGTAVGECMTASVGFRAPHGRALAADVLQRIVDAAVEEDSVDDSMDGGIAGTSLYRDAGTEATAHPARIPRALQRFADAAVAKMAADRRSRGCALGETLSEPKPGTWFEAGSTSSGTAGVALDRRTRMLYDASHIFINGESFRAGGRDATLMRRLADQRRLDAKALAQLSPQAAELLAEWSGAGWCLGLDSIEEDTT
jgi:50S ribosomal protein L16 3-hydroxylase